MQEFQQSPEAVLVILPTSCTAAAVQKKGGINQSREDNVSSK
jgi:hypothetical protein